MASAPELQKKTASVQLLVLIAANSSCSDPVMDAAKRLQSRLLCQRAGGGHRALW